MKAIDTKIRLLRSNYETGMSPIPVLGTLPDWPALGANGCSCGRPDCYENAGKHPRIRWKGFSRPPWGCVEEWIQKFERIDSPLNWAFHLGASGLVGLDIDPRNGGI